MSKEENSGKKWIWCLVILVVIFTALWMFYNHYSYSHYLLNKNTRIYIILYFSSLFISMIVSHYITTLLCSTNISEFFSKIKFQFAVLLIIEILAIGPIITRQNVTPKSQIAIMSIGLSAIVFLALTKFFYTEPECWLKRMWANIEEWLSNLDSFFNKLLPGFALSLILFVFIVYTVVSLIFYFVKLKITLENIGNILNSFNGDLFNLIFNLLLVVFFTFIISVFSQSFFKTNNSSKITSEKDSEFLFYLSSTKLIIILSIALFIAYALTHAFILTHINNKISLTQLLLISAFYTLFIFALFYFPEKLLKVINFAMHAHRLQMKIKVLSHSPLNKNMLRLWNAFWRDEKFGDALSEGAFLSSFVPKIVYHKRLFQIKEKVSVAADALRGFSENIDKRYSEALAREVLNIVPRRYTQPKRLPEYLVDALNAYKDIVCNDKLVCEDLDSSTFLYKQSFGDKADEYMSKYKYKYLDELIYQILVTLRKSIEKLRNDKYFEKHDESRKILCEKFNDFIKEIMNLKCDKLESALKTESAKKWIKEANALLRTINKANYYNCSSLLSDFTKTLQTLKKFENLP